MNAIDHFTIPLPTLGYIVTFVRIHDRVAFHGARMSRDATGFKQEGDEVHEWVTIPLRPDAVKDACLELAQVAAQKLAGGDEEQEDALRGTLHNAITTRPQWKQ